MPGPRTNAAFYAAPVEEFLTASEEEVYAPLANPHGYTLAALKSWGVVQQSAWRLQLPVLRAALEGLVAPRPAAPAPWIHLDFDIPRLGLRGDAVLVTQKCVIPIEFKGGAKKFERLDEEQAWDFRIDLKNFHAPSHAAAIFPILCATEARDSDRRWKPPLADGVRPPFCCNGESLSRAIRLAQQDADKKVPAPFSRVMQPHRRTPQKWWLAPFSLVPHHRAPFLRTPPSASPPRCGPSAPNMSPASSKPSSTAKPSRAATFWPRFASSIQSCSRGACGRPGGGAAGSGGARSGRGSWPPLPPSGSSPTRSTFG